MRRRWLAWLGIHCILSMTLLAAGRVWQKCWNRTHRKQVCLASVTVGTDAAEVTVLGSTRSLPLLPDSGGIWYAAAILTDVPVQLWIWCVREFTVYL